MLSHRSVVIDERFYFEEETHLTVHKTSVLVPGGDGFIAYNSTGEIVFRVDSYGPESDSRDEIVLMDSTGKSLVTLYRKRPSLRQRWEGFLGEKKEEKKPIFRTFKSSIIGRFDVVAEVYSEPSEEYHIEGSFVDRSCAVYNTYPNTNFKELVAEIKRKVDPDTNVMLGKDVFLLCLKSKTDGALVMALVLVLDHMGGFDSADTVAGLASVSI